jgi:hypothetical protein
MQVKGKQNDRRSSRNKVPSLWREQPLR